MYKFYIWIILVFSKHFTFIILSVQFNSVAQSCPTLCDATDCSTPGLLIHHWLPEFAQTHVHRSRWCHPTTSSSVVPFSSRLQSFPASGSFPMSQFFASGGQSIGVSTSASVLPMNIQDWFPLGWSDWISLQFKEVSRVFSSTTVQKHQFFSAQSSLWSNLHPYMTTGKNIALTRWTSVGKVISLLFNMLSRFAIAFLPRNKCLLISWLQSPPAVILEPKRRKSVIYFPPSICHDVVGLILMFCHGP